MQSQLKTLFGTLRRSNGKSNIIRAEKLRNLLIMEVDDAQAAVDKCVARVGSAKGLLAAASKNDPDRGSLSGELENAKAELAGLRADLKAKTEKLEAADSALLEAKAALTDSLTRQAGLEGRRMLLGKLGLITGEFKDFVGRVEDHLHGFDDEYTADAGDLIDGSKDLIDDLAKLQKKYAA